MSHIDIHPTCIQQEAPIAWRFIMPTIMPVNNAVFFPAKQMLNDPVGNPRRRHVRLIGLDKQAIFGLNTEDSIMHRDLALPGFRWQIGTQRE